MMMSRESTFHLLLMFVVHSEGQWSDETNKEFERRKLQFKHQTQIKEVSLFL